MQKILKMPRPPFRPKVNHTFYRKSNPSRETVPLSIIFISSNRFLCTLCASCPLICLGVMERRGWGGGVRNHPWACHGWGFKWFSPGHIKGRSPLLILARGANTLTLWTFNSPIIFMYARPLIDNPILLYINAETSLWDFLSDLPKF